jgi:signal transduction histidine kinase/ligand-binding sensor domain-containing protein
MEASYRRDSDHAARQAWRAWLAILGWIACAPVSALERDRTIAQFYHTAWTVKEGAPGQISALAQTTDGYIWLAAAAALYRFDGVRFERFEGAGGDALPAGSVSALKALDDGSLWIGFQFGGVSLLKDGRLTHYGDREGMPVGTVFGFADDRQHAVWAATVKGLMRFEGSSWQSIGAEWNYPEGKSKAVFVDRDGTLWAATGETLMSLAPGARRFEDTGRRAGWVVQMAQAPDGNVWTAEAFGAVQATTSASGGAPASASVIRVESGGLLFDRDGALWVGSLGDGLRRVAYPERAVLDRGSGEIASEPFMHTEGLSADYVWPIIEDHEGNIWLGTSGGLDEFRHSAIAPALFPPGSHDLALAAGDDGAVWAGTTNRALMRLRNKIVTTTDGAMRTTCAYRAEDGTIWLGGRQGIWRIVGDEPTLVTGLPEGVGEVDVQSMVMDRRGVLWVGITNAGLFRFAGGTWSRVDDSAFSVGSHKLLTPLVAISDAQGRILLGYGRAGLVVIDGDATKVFAAGNGLDLGNVSALKQGSSTIWVGGERGLASFDGSHFRTLGVEGELLRGVVGIIETADGSLWVHAISGVLHFSGGEVAHALVDPAYRMRYRLFDFLDGLPARPTQLRPLPTTIESSDGRLWFATTNGAAWIDPKRIATNVLPPPVVIESLSVGDKRFPVTSALKLPERTKQIEVDYTALSFSVPERVRFRYRLDGVDGNWQEAGTRRQAIYTNLGPGDYRFHVVAANEDGIWNETGAVLNFEIASAYYQTWWFRALYVVLAAVVIGLLFYLRMLGVLSRMRERLEERHDERARIARELHDTLLQSIQGLMLRFQIVADAMPAGSEAQTAMERALDCADDVLAEGRDRVSDLRSSIESGKDLVQAFTIIGEHMAADHDVEFRALVEGEEQRLHADISDEVFRIGREALVNAFQHAHAASIEIEIAFESDALRVRVRDDGIGIDTGILEAGCRPDHWGLPGMRERALKIGARLDLWGGAGSGTEVELRVPASTAYLADSRRSWRQFVRRLVGVGR